MKKCILVFLFLLLAIPALSIPQQIYFQGILLDDSDNPVTGTHDFIFRIYNTASGGSALWEETHSGVSVNNGLYTVKLGGSTSIPSSLFSGDTRYIGIQVDTDTEMSPRVRVLSVPFAYRSLNADNADTVDNIHASSTPESDKLYPLGSSARFPVSVITQGPGSGLDADTVDGLHANEIGGGGLTTAEADARYINIDGDAMTDTLTVSASSAVLVDIQSAASGGKGIVANMSGGGMGYAGHFTIGNSNFGSAVYGFAGTAGGTNYGGYFEAGGDGGMAVRGYASSTNQDSYGGNFGAERGSGVYGYVNSTTLIGQGVRGTTGYNASAGVARGGLFETWMKYGTALVATHEIEGRWAELGTPTHAGHFGGDVTVEGNVYANNLYGDGSNLTGIATAGSYVLKGGDSMSGTLTISASSDYALYATNESTVSYAKLANSTPSGWGVLGVGDTGVRGQDLSGNYGALGYNGYGVWASGGGGVYSYASGTGSAAFYGTSAGSNGYGISVSASGTGGTGIFTTAEANSAWLATPAHAGRFYGNVTVEGDVFANNYYGDGSNLTGVVELGPAAQQSTSSDPAIWVKSTATFGRGISAEAEGSLGRGVYGFSASGAGGWFESSGSSGVGCRGYNTSTTSPGYGGYFVSQASGGTALYATAQSTAAATNYGARFQANGTSGRAVYGRALAVGSYVNHGGYFEANGDYGRGVYAHAGSSTGTNYGVYAETSSSDGWGGYFSGGRGVYGDRFATDYNSTSSYNLFGNLTTTHTNEIDNSRDLLLQDLEVDGKVFLDGVVAGTGDDLQVLSTGEVVKVVSSKKFKKDILDLSVDYDKFMTLRPVKFRWNEKSATPDVEDYGLIAEEVNEIAPELVGFDANGEPMSVRYRKVNTLLLKVLQDQQKLVQEQQAEIAELRKENLKMRAKLGELETDLGMVFDLVQKKPGGIQKTSFSLVDGTENDLNN